LWPLEPSHCVHHVVQVQILSCIVGSTFLSFEIHGNAWWHPLNPPSSFKYKFLMLLGLPTLKLLQLLCILLISNKGKEPLVFYVCCGAHDLGASTFVFPSNCNKYVVDLAKWNGLRIVDVIKNRKQKNEWALNMTFQDSWARKFPWVELVKFLDGIFFYDVLQILYHNWI